MASGSASPVVLFSARRSVASKMVMWEVTIILLLRVLAAFLKLTFTFDVKLPFLGSSTREGSRRAYEAKAWLLDVWVGVGVGAAPQRPKMRSGINSLGGNMGRERCVKYVGVLPPWGCGLGAGVANFLDLTTHVDKYPKTGIAEQTPHCELDANVNVISEHT